MDTMLEMERNKAHGGLSDLRPFVGVPSKTSSKELPGATEELFRGIVEILNNLLLRAIETQTKEDFIFARSEVFDDVRKTSRAMSNLARVIVPQRTLERLTWQSFSELEAELMEQGSRRIGTVARDQAVFTIWTFKRFVRLLGKLVDTEPLPKELQERDKIIAKKFSLYVDWAHFHLECLIESMRTDKPIHPEVLEEICDGMRAAVNAYGLLRQGLELRFPTVEGQSDIALEWTEEDQELLDSSMADIAKMEIEEY